MKMGYDPSAYALIGVRINDYELKEERDVRGCQHAIEMGAKFCSTCGKQAFVKEEYLIEGFDECKETLDGFKIVRVREHAYVCYLCSDANNYSNDKSRIPLNVNDIKNAKEKLKSVLEPRGLWKESEFGLWAVLGEG
jgi:hypothetical protein